MSNPLPILWQIDVSHFSEKARWTCRTIFRRRDSHEEENVLRGIGLLEIARLR